MEGTRRAVDGADGVRIGLLTAGERVSAMVADGQAGRAVFSFLTEIIGLTRAEVEALRDAPGGRDVLPIAAATLPREARAATVAELPGRFPGLNSSRIAR